MNNDVREAAKRLRLFDARAGNPYTLGPQASMKANIAFLHDLSKLADAYLAEHPEDDDELADDTWLQSIGFSESGLRGMTRLLPPLDSKAAICELCIHDQGVSIIQGVPDDPHVGDDIVSLTSMPFPRTRGDVRRLLTALGIER